MANVCAVRMRNADDPEYFIPHEPESEERYALELVHQVGRRSGFALCKHCGSLYRTEDR